MPWRSDDRSLPAKGTSLNKPSDPGMPLEDSIYLKPEGGDSNEQLDGIKQYLSGAISEIDFTGTNTDLVMGLKAGVDHIAIEMFPHADSLVRQAQREGSGVQITGTGGEKVFRSGKRFDWEAMLMQPIVEAEEEVLWTVVRAARAEIKWLGRHVWVLEELLAKAKERKAEGGTALLVFEVEPREELEG